MLINVTLKREKKMTKFNENAKLESGTVLVATYGSLRHGMGNFPCNLSAGGVFVATGLSVETFQLYEFGSGSFPSISLNPEHTSEETQKLVVDIFATTTKGLEGPYDCLEGHYPHALDRSFYNRTEKEFTLREDAVIDGETVKAGTTVTAWVYHIDEEQQVPVNHGDWCIHKRGESYYDTVDYSVTK